MAEIVKLSQPGRPGQSSRNRFAPTVLIVMLLVFLAAMAPVLAKYRNAPEDLVAKLQAISAQAPPAPTADMKHKVWVNRRSGLYYCHESKFYGRMYPGVSMQQESALLKGFRPAEGQMCP